MSVNILDKVIETFSELKRLHELNTELLDELCVAIDWVFENEPQVPNAKILYSLLNKSRALLSEIQADTPKILQYKKLANESLHEPQNKRRLYRTVLRVL
jgi:hypothetical protein